MKFERTMSQIQKLILVLIFFTFTNCITTSGSLNLPKNDQGQYQYRGIVEVSNKSQIDLYDQAKEWVALNFRSAQDVIQLDDRENGHLIAKGNFQIYYKMWNRHVHHTMIIETKDGRYRYTIKDFVFQTADRPRIPLEQSTLGSEFGKKLDSTVKSTLSSLEDKLKGQEEEW